MLGPLVHVWNCSPVRLAIVASDCPGVGATSLTVHIAAESNDIVGIEFYELFVQEVDDLSTTIYRQKKKLH